MVLIDFSVLVLRTNLASTLEGLTVSTPRKGATYQYCTVSLTCRQSVSAFVACRRRSCSMGSTFSSCFLSCCSTSSHRPGKYKFSKCFTIDKTDQSYVNKTKRCLVNLSHEFPEAVHIYFYSCLALMLVVANFGNKKLCKKTLKND